MSWYKNNGRLTHNGLPELLPCLSPPYPPGIWYTEDSRLSHTRLPLMPHAGAFCGCTGLKKVMIPESVRYIGKYAFADTALVSVRISSECEYSPTSFPEDCEITFY